MNKALTFLAGAGIGGGLMYMLDPDRGRSRRAFVRDKSVGAWNDTSDAVRKTSRDLGNRATGVVSSARSVFTRGGGTENLVERIRSRIGRVVSHARAIEITEQGGLVTVSGPVLASEVSDLIKTIRGVKGVESIENQLDVHQTAENVPELQGGEERGRFNRALDSPAARAVAGVAGGALAAYGLSRRHRTIGKAATAAGFGLLTRTAPNRRIRTLLKVLRFAA